MAISIENNAKKQLLWRGMGSIIMFFEGLTAAYIVRKPEGDWIDFMLPEYFTISTIIIVIYAIDLIKTMSIGSVTDVLRYEDMGEKKTE